MIVLGKHAFIFESTGKTCNVQPFSTDLGIATNVPIVDGAIAYECPYSHKVYILIARNALYMPSLTHNLIPPFIMRAGGATVNDTAKIHCNDPTVNDHCIIFKNADLRIPLQLTGTFSYFHSRLPLVHELHDCDKVFITPDASDWNPNCTSFELNERTMTNFEGELQDPIRRSNIQMNIDDEASEIFELAAVKTDDFEAYIDAQISVTYASESHDINNDEDTIDLNDHFAQALSLRGEISKFGASIGSCSISHTSDCSLFLTPSTTTLDDLESHL